MPIIEPASAPHGILTRSSLQGIAILAKRSVWRRDRNGRGPAALTFQTFMKWGGMRFVYMSGERLRAVHDLTKLT